MQFVAILPDQLHAPNLFGQMQPKHQRRPPPSHAQTPIRPSLHSHRLCRPVQGKEALVLIRIPDLPVSFAQLLGGVHIRQELVADHLDRLAVEAKPSFGGLLQVLPIRPAGMLLPSSPMQIPTPRPDASGFLLCLVEAPPQGWRSVRKR